MFIKCIKFHKKLEIKYLKFVSLKSKIESCLSIQQDMKHKIFFTKFSIRYILLSCYIFVNYPKNIRLNKLGPFCVTQRTPCKDGSGYTPKIFIFLIVNNNE